MKKLVKIITITTICCAWVFVLAMSLKQENKWTEYTKNYPISIGKDYAIIVPFSNSSVLDIFSQPLKKEQAYVWVVNNDVYIPWHTIESSITEGEIKDMFNNLQKQKLQGVDFPYSKTLTSSLIRLRGYVHTDITSKYDYCVINNVSRNGKGDYNSFCFDASSPKPYFSVTDNWREF